MSPSLASQEPAAILEEFSSWLKLQKRLSSETERSYRSQIQKLVRSKFWQGFKNPNFEPDDRGLEDFLVAESHKLSPTSQSQHISALKKFQEFLLEEHPSLAPRLRGISRLSSPKLEKRMRKSLTREKLRELQKALEKEKDPEDLLLFYLLAGSGLRLFEAQKLQFQDIDWRQGLLEILGKGKGRRQVPLHPRAIEILKDLQKLFPKQTSPFSKRKSLRGLRDRVAKWNRFFLDSDSECLHPHLLRHSIASELLSGGMDLKNIQKFLGHKRLSSTEIYTHLKNEDLFRAYDQKHPRALSKKKDKA